MTFKVMFILSVVIITSMCMGLFSYYHARNMLYERVIESELPAHLFQIKSKVESDIKLITENAKTLLYLTGLQEKTLKRKILTLISNNNLILSGCLGETVKHISIGIKMVF